MVKEKIDRILVNDFWPSCFPNFYAVALPAIGSDHTPISINLFSGLIQNKKDFIFESFWTKKDDFNNILKESWLDWETEAASGTMMNKLRRTANLLHTWSIRTFRRADLQIKKIKYDLAKLQNGQWSEEIWIAQRDLKKQLNTLWKQRRSLLGSES